MRVSSSSMRLTRHENIMAALTMIIARRAAVDTSHVISVAASFDETAPTFAYEQRPMMQQLEMRGDDYAQTYACHAARCG